MLNVRDAILELKNLPSTLGVVTVGDLGKGVDALVRLIDIEAAVQRVDFEEVARLENAPL